MEYAVGSSIYRLADYHVLTLFAPEDIVLLNSEDVLVCCHTWNNLTCGLDCNTGLDGKGTTVLSNSSVQFQLIEQILFYCRKLQL